MDNARRALQSHKQLEEDHEASNHTVTATLTLSLNQTKNLKYFTVQLI